VGLNDRRHKPLIKLHEGQVYSHNERSVQTAPPDSSDCVPHQARGVARRAARLDPSRLPSGTKPGYHFDEAEYHRGPRSGSQVNDRGAGRDAGGETHVVIQSPGRSTRSADARLMVVHGACCADAILSYGCPTTGLEWDTHHPR